MIKMNQILILIAKTLEGKREAVHPILLLVGKENVIQL
jgi:hypothetical protein